MPAFPTEFYPFLQEGFEPVPDSGIRTDRSENGTIRGQRLQLDDVWNLEIELAPITKAQLNTLDIFFETNRDAADITWINDGETYTVRYLNRHRARPQPGGHYMVSIEFTGTRA